MDTQIQETKNPKKNSKILNIVVDVVLILAILLAALCAYSAFATKDEQKVPSVFGIKVFIIKSDSMDPTFKTGDLIISKTVKDPETLVASTTREAKDGDIITFHTYINGKPALNSHRIVDKKFVKNASDGYWEFTTRGDNVKTNNYDDYFKVRFGNIEGKYLFRIRGVGKFIQYMQKPTGFFLVIVLPVALFFIWQLVQFFRSLFAYQAEKVKLQYQAQMQAQGFVPVNVPENGNADGAAPPPDPKKNDNDPGLPGDPQS